MPRMQDALDKRTAAASIDTYYEANLLTGEATSESVEQLTKKAPRIKEKNERLFVYWTSSSAAAECQAIGPATRCFCNHSYSSHAWYETETKRVRCRWVEGCRCACFSYVPGRGATHIRCGCKHEHHEHRTSDGRPGPCSHPGCDCKGFHSNWRCARSQLHAFLAICIPRSRSFAVALSLRRCGSCGEAYDEHTTIFETAADRARAGKATESNLGGWSNEKPHLDAVCGGVTRMSSLLTGVERAGIGPLQHTDGMTCVPCDENAAPITPFSSTAEVFANYDRKADAHVARLRKLKEARESLQFAGGSQGQRLGHQGAASTNSSSNAVSAASGGGGKALVPRPPAGGAGAVRPGAGGRSSASTTTGGTAAARPVVNSNRPPTKAAMRELAAAAAEARFGGSEAAVEEAPRPPPARTVAAAAPSPAPSKRATATARGGPGGTTRSSAGGPRGQAKLAVAAARRERAAGAAEARMSVAAEA